MSDIVMLNKFWKAVDEHKLYASSANLRFHLESAFAHVEFSGKRVLDIGAGIGLCSFYAASMGAKEVVALEPEADGSTAGVGATFEDIKKWLGANQVSLATTTIQEFDPGASKYDVVISHASINHFDEEACIKLHTGDKQAADSYGLILKHISSMSANGAKIVVIDVSRYNFWNMLHVSNPFCKYIEWEKHQSPQLWAKVLANAGFCNPKVQWRSLNRLGEAGKALFGNKAAAFFHLSEFFLTMEKP